MAEAMDGIGSGGTLNEQPGLFIPSMQRVHGSGLIPVQPVVMKDGRQVMPVASLAALSSADLQAAQHVNFATQPRELIMSVQQAIDFQIKAHQAYEALYTTDGGRFKRRTHYPWGGLQSAAATTATPGTASQEPGRPLLLSELQARELQARELQARELQARELQARELQARELQARELQARELQARERQARELQARELQARQRIAQEHALEQIVREQAREQMAHAQALERIARDQQARDQQARDQQARDQQARDQQARDQQARDQQARDQQARDQQARDQQARDQQARDQQARDQQARDQQARDQPARDQPARDQPARDQPAREQQAREQHQEEKLSLNYSQQLTFQAMLDAKRCPESIQQGSFVPQSLPQKLTREVPEGEKNDVYWEKRHKNNLSAKRSREKQRIHENETKIKVLHMEETNAKLRKKLAMLKKRHGLPENQSIMTPEERRLCEIEKESFVKRTEARLGCREEDMAGHVSTTVKKEVKKNTARPPKTASSDVDASVPDGRPDVSRGPSTPAPFIPPQSWPPVAMQPVSGSIPVQNYLPRAGPSSSSVGSQLREGTVPFNTILDRGVEGFISPHYDLISPHYDFYMQYISQRHQMLQRACDYVSRCAGLPAAALNNDSKGRHEQRGLSTRSSGGALDMRHGNTEVLPANVAQSAAGSRDYVNYMGHAAAMLPPPQVYNQFDGHFKVPLPVNPFRRRSSQRSETAPSDGKDRIKNQEDTESLIRETEGLRMTVQNEHQGLREHKKYNGQEPNQ